MGIRSTVEWIMGPPSNQSAALQQMFLRCFRKGRLCWLELAHASFQALHSITVISTRQFTRLPIAGPTAPRRIVVGRRKLPRCQEIFTLNLVGATTTIVIGWRALTVLRNHRLIRHDGQASATGRCEERSVSERDFVSSNFGSYSALFDRSIFLGQLFGGSVGVYSLGCLPVRRHQRQLGAAPADDTFPEVNDLIALGR